MKRYILISAICLTLLFLSGPAMAKKAAIETTANGVGGFILGDAIDNYQDVIRMNTSMPIRYLESVHEVEIQGIPEFKSGLIAYGSCVEKGKIIRIKLKYADSSRKFFELLMKKFKERFGEPTEWKGDSFGVVITWKWSIKNDKGEKISLIIQHNLLDTEEKVGNVVKMTLTQAMDEEIECYKKADPRVREKKRKSLPSPIDWDKLLPH